MPTKTDRILTVLPGTFKPLPRPTILYFLADAFGGELQNAENSLAAVMMAHWVDKADQGADLIGDLACFAALYGLVPIGATPVDQPSLTCPPVISDESVEGFRSHLKRYVQTLLDGTVTVEGILRIVAEALGVEIADAYADLDTWWRRRTDSLVDIVARGDDASRLVFGVDEVRVQGQPARAAAVAGAIDLSAGVDLSSGAMLRIDLGAPVDVDLAPGIANLSAATLTEVVNRINLVLGSPIAGADRGHLALTAPLMGAASRLTVYDLDGDAAPVLLGLLPQHYAGSNATAATVTGTADLGAGVDLGTSRYLRLQLDRVQSFEVDCAAGSANPASVTLGEIVAAINQAIGQPVASATGQRLRLTSSTTGFGSSIAVAPAAAQDAATTLLGAAPTFVTGRDSLPAQVVGRPDISAGVDLSGGSEFRVRVDGQPAIIVACAGRDAANTTLVEVVAAINGALGPGHASHDGQHVRLASTTAGDASKLAFEALPGGVDGLEAIFGIQSRTFVGNDASPARFAGQSDLGAGLNLGAQHISKVALDSGPAQLIDVAAGATDPRNATLKEIEAGLNAALGPGIASDDGTHLVLTSPASGGQSSIAIEPLLTKRRRRFISRAFVTGEAAQVVLGSATASATGTAAGPASVAGAADLSRGVDVSQSGHLRVGIDGGTAVDVDVSAFSLRPREALGSDIANAINVALRNANPLLQSDVAVFDGTHLHLTSPTSGTRSRIDLEASTYGDARDVLLGLAPQVVRGSDATQVRFTGTADLAPGVDLSAAPNLKIALDGAAPVEFSVAGATPAATLISEATRAINAALKASVATQNGRFITIASTATGAQSRLEFDAPAAGDATPALLGITPPRSYQGAVATAASMRGQRDLAAGVDLRSARFLQLAVDGGQARAVDCAAQAKDPSKATLDEVVAAINAAVPALASAVGSHLLLTSASTGATSQLDLQAYTAEDARPILLGNAPSSSQGIDAGPAVIVGSADLSAPVNLSARQVLRISLDGGRPIDVNVAGDPPEQSRAMDIVGKINEQFPRLADLFPEQRLRLTTRSVGEESSIDVLPLRTIDVLEYPAEPVEFPASGKPDLTLAHGGGFPVDNAGVANTQLTLTVGAAAGVVGPSLVNRSTERRIQFLAVLGPGERLRAWEEQGKVRAILNELDGSQRDVPPDQIRAGHLGLHVDVPFDGDRPLASADRTNVGAIQLEDVQAPGVLTLRARTLAPSGSIRVAVGEASLAALPPTPPADGDTHRVIGRFRFDGGKARLVDRKEATIVTIREGQSDSLAPFDGAVVAADGPLHPGKDVALLIVDRVARLFDVAVKDGDGGPHDVFNRVTVGYDVDRDDSLLRQVVYRPARLVHALLADRAGALELAPGRSEWLYLDCYGARFNAVRFNAAGFAGGVCRERGIFDISQFATSTGPEGPVFAGTETEPSAQIRFQWIENRPGAFVVNLPADLPDAFGATFNAGRFARPATKPEEYPAVVLEPAGDPKYIGLQLQASTLVAADAVDRVPLGFEPTAVPFPGWRSLTGGSATQAAQIFLEKTGSGFIRVQATKPGGWGNGIQLRVRKAGLAQFDVTISYPGARFERARQLVLGVATTSLADEALNPGPLTILQSKAAGIRAATTRERADVAAD